MIWARGIINILEQARDITRSLITIDYSHSKVHQGDMFTIDSLTPEFNGDVLNQEALEILITATGTNNPHVVISYRLGGAGRIEIYQFPDSVGISGGDAVVIANKNWRSTTEFGGTAVRNPTITEAARAGATLRESCLILGTVQGQSRTGGGGGFNNEIIIKAGKPCLIRLVNQSGGTIKACLCVDVYNSL